MTALARSVRTVAALVLCALPLFAGSVRAAEAETPTVTVDDVLAEEADRETHRFGLWRARLGYPLTVSAGVGLMVSRLPASWDCMTVCELRGFTFQVEPGLTGGQLSVGYALLLAEKKHRRHFFSNVYFGAGIKAVLLRTWGEANLTPPDQTFVGFELASTVTGFNIATGLLRRVDDGPGGNDWRAMVSLGWGF